MDLKNELQRAVASNAHPGLSAARRPARMTASTATLCAVTLLGLGCASTTAAEGSPRSAAPIASAPARRALVAEPSSVEVSPYTDSPAAVTVPKVAPASGDGLVGALAASYESDMKALAEMQFRRAASKPSLASAAAPDVPLPALSPAAPAAAPADATAPASPAPAAATAPPAAMPAPATAASAPTSAPTPAPSEPAVRSALPAQTPSAAEGTTPAPAAPQPSAVAAPAASTQANAPLELPPTVPTDSKSLARLLADSLVREGGESETPLEPWLGFAALAITDPSIELPKDFGADLLPAERERVTKARAAFAALGKALRDGRGEVDRATIEQLAAALSGGPRLAIPKVELCTRVEGFGRFDAIAMKRFPARRVTRFIAYTELEGFTSALEQGRFTTRLATRIAIEAQSDGTEVWNRSPEWTAVVDASDVRRGEFFVGEIVPLSDSLSVGGYLLKVTVRDEATGASATSSIPFQIVADSGLATVPGQ